MYLIEDVSYIWLEATIRVEINKSESAGKSLTLAMFPGKLLLQFLLLLLKTAKANAVVETWILFTKKPATKEMFCPPTTN